METVFIATLKVQTDGTLTELERSDLNKMLYGFCELMEDKLERAIKINYLHEKVSSSVKVELDLSHVYGGSE